MSALEQEVQARLGRAGVYRLLGAALAYPADADLAATVTMARAVGAPDDPAVATRLDAFAAAAGAAEPGTLAEEHVFLFDRGAGCSPYEAAWGEAPQMAGKSAMLADIAGFYAAFGLEPASARPDVEDHIAVECEFMSALAVKEAYALARGDAEGAEITRDAQARFLGAHLGRWADAFASALRDATPLPYYAALADLLAAWMTAERGRYAIDPPSERGPVGPDTLRDEDTFICPMVEPASEPVDEDV